MADQHGLWQNPVLLLCFLLSIFIIKKIWRSEKKKKQFNLPPSPPRLPIIGNLHQLTTMPHQSFRALSDKHGPIVHLQLGHIPTVVVSSAELAKEVLKTHDLALASRPQLFSAKHLFYNCTDIAFAPYGAYWRRVRKICTLELLSTRRVESFRAVREQEVANMVTRVKNSSHSGTTNLTKEFGVYANDVLCRIALGRDFSKTGDYDRLGFQKMLEDYEELLGGFSLGDFFPSLEFLHSITGMKSKLQRTFQKFDKFFDEVLAEHLDPKRDPNHHKDLVDVLLHLHKDASTEMPLTVENVKAIILDMFAAGTDTTNITLEWAMIELILNPQVMRKAQTELRSALGARQTVSESDLASLHYIKAVVKETLRLHPPVPILVPRESMEDIKIGGYDVPSKTRVFVNAWAIARDPRYWEDPDGFCPERFLGGSSRDFKGQDFELLPFGAGRRGCPGITLGIAVIELAVAQLLHSFDWELPPGVKPEDLDLREVFGISMHKKSELLLSAVPHFS
uniref:Cytochrome P450 n=1 Tax=Kalanchoe fedtschenkoi TaxID=63787 RepID=A0A7N0ZYQ9_KALFE